MLILSTVNMDRPPVKCETAPIQGECGPQVRGFRFPLERLRKVGLATMQTKSPILPLSLRLVCTITD